ncbi:hypothetical protein PsYK624_013770 [Phanerochaete sordida]|uniref:Uncharacterized protein n=1 Tax=Phanerochaete sordida TaxID=48140 RepID=A0A9P3FZ75_9APHY|nr:hypothetical protein PsYK624_013770 [Phanerochaete sordida]
MARATQRGTRENSILSIVRYSSARRENGPGWRGRHSGELHARARRLGGVRPDGEGVLVWERVPPLRPPPAPAGPSGGGLTRRCTGVTRAATALPLCGGGGRRTFQVWPSSPAVRSICALDRSQQARLVTLDASTCQPQPRRHINKASRAALPLAPNTVLATTHFPLLRARRFLSHLDRPDSWSCAGTARSQPPLWPSLPAPGASLVAVEGDVGGDARTGLSVARARYKPPSYDCLRRSRRLRVESQVSSSPPPTTLANVLRGNRTIIGGWRLIGDQLTACPTTAGPRHPTIL